MDRQVGTGQLARAYLRLPWRARASVKRNPGVGPRVWVRLSLGAAVAAALVLAGCGDSKSAFEDYSFPRTSSESGRYLSGEEHARLRQQWQEKQDAQGAQASPQASGGG